MHILILKNTVADGKPVSAGSTVDVGDSDARLLIRMGKAQAVTAADPVAVVAEAAPEPVAVVATEQRRPGRPRRAG